MRVKSLVFLPLLLGSITTAAFAQAPAPQGAPLPRTLPPPPDAAAAPPPGYPQAELERIVSPIALYPDPLLAQVLAAATFASDIPEAARWADQHHYMTDGALASAIAADRLPWDPAVQALLPFPSVLDMMASAMPWTEEIGTAFLIQQGEVMDAVQRMRQRAQSSGYLRTTPNMTVRTGPYIEILPANPAYIVVPYYDPLVVFAPRRGVVVSGGIALGYGVRIGAVWAPWGWGTTRFGWGERVVFVNNAPWRRTWVNRVTYVHPYHVPRYDAGRRPAEPHRAIERSPREREDARKGRKDKEEHKRPPR